MSAPLGYELRFWPELARLFADPRFWSPEQAQRRRGVLLIPGFMAGDASLTVLARLASPARARGAHERHPR